MGDAILVAIVATVLVVIAFMAVMGVVLSMGMVLWMLPRRVGVVILVLTISGAALVAWQIGWFPAALTFFVGNGASVTVGRFATFARKRGRLGSH